MVRRIQKYTDQTDLYMAIDEEVVHLIIPEEEVLHLTVAEVGVHLTAAEEEGVHLTAAEEEGVHRTAVGRTKLLCTKMMENSVQIPQPVAQRI
jgi:hypothetical protein